MRMVRLPIFLSLAAGLSACATNTPTPPNATPSATLPPAPTPQNHPAADAPADPLANIPPDLLDPLKSALAASGQNRPQWIAALQQVPANQKPGLAYLLANMPAHDLRELTKDFLLENVSLAYAARANAPWGPDIPEEIFLQALLPYASVNEARDPWRKEFAQKFAPLVADCQTPGQAAVLLNAKVFPAVKVVYNATLRPKPDQSPRESIAAGYASCTGLSVLLIDACRSVGVPARMVGTPLWTVPKGDANGNNAGNHMWVEIWDGQWHALGASEAGKLDETWFLENASRAIEGRDEKIDGIFAHRIYAAMLNRDATWFPLVWDLTNKEVTAEDVTLAYADRQSVKLTLESPTGHPAQALLTLRQEGRLVAHLKVTGSTTLLLSGNQTYDATVSVGGREDHQKVAVPKGKDAEVVVRVGD